MPMGNGSSVRHATHNHKPMKSQQSATKCQRANKVAMKLRHRQAVAVYVRLYRRWLTPSYVRGVQREAMQLAK